MFAHQVIEALIDSARSGQNSQLEGYSSAREAVLHDLLNSQKFHLGKSADIVNPKWHPTGGDEALFYGKNADVKLPYQCCWFDYIRSVTNGKIGILACEDDLDKSSFYVNIFMDFGVVSRDYGWTPIPMGIHIRPGKEELGTIYHWNAGLDKNAKIKVFDTFAPHIRKSLTVLNFALLLLSCRNIGQEKVIAPAKLNKKRLSRGKVPLFTYHTLVVKPSNAKQESIPRHLWENRIHLCRGHFKTYTEEKPLFGHITGRFWWQPSVRGRNREGVVMKDYVVDKSMGEVVNA